MLAISQDIIFHQLKQHFDVFFEHRSDNLVRVAGPRCFSGTPDDFGHVVLVEKSQGPAFAEWARTNMISAAQAGRRRTGTDEDIQAAFADAAGTLFVFLGQHAARKVPSEAGVSLVVLRNADLGRAFNALASIYQAFDAWHEALLAAMEANDPFKRIVDACDDILGGPVSIVDEDFVYVAYSDASVENGMVESSDGVDVGVPEYILQEYYSSPDFRNINERRGVFLQSFTLGDGVLKNLFHEGRYIGRMAMRLVPYDEEIFRYDAAMLDCLAPVVEHVYSQHRSFHTVDEPLAGTRQTLARSLAGQAATQQELETATTLLGWAHGDELQLVQLLPNLRYDSNPYPLRTIPFIEERWSGCVGFEHQDKLFVVVNLDCFHADRGDGLDQALSYLVRDELMTAGISDSFYNLADLHEAFVQTEAALAVGATDDSMKWTFRFSDCAVRFLVANSTGPFADDALALVSSKVRKLAAHDAERGTDYCHTLQEYLRCHMNASATARALFIHRSSFLARMEHINALVDLHLESADEVLYLAWSYQIMESLGLLG